MIRFCTKNKGAIAVFMSLIIVMTFAFGCLIIDGTRILSSKSIILGAGDLAMNAALSNYDAELKYMYGLLGMKELSTDVSEYFNNSLNAGNLSTSGKYGGLIQLDTESFSLYNVDGSQVCETEPMRQQILEYAKYRAPLAFGDEMLDKLKSLNKKLKVAKAVKKQLIVSEKLKEVDEICEKLKEQLEKHNNDCSQKPSDREIQNLEQQLEYLYRRVSIMLKIEAAISYYEPDPTLEGKTTKECVEGYLAALQSVDINSSSPENYFSSIMAALSYAQFVSVSKLDNMVASASSEEEKEQLRQLRRDYEAKSTWIDNYRNNVSNLKRQYISQAYTDILHKYHSLGDDAITSAEEAYPIIDEIIDMLENDSNGLQTAMNEWKNSIEELEGTEKEQQERLYDSYKQLMDSSSVKEMKQCLEDNVEYFQKFKAYWESFEFCGVAIVNVSEPREEFTTKAGRYFSSKYTNNELLSVADEFFWDEYTHWNYTDIMTGMMYHNLNEHPYFQKLKEIYESSTDENVDSKKDEKMTEGQKLLDELLGGVLNLQDADWSGTIPSEWLSQSGADSASSEVTELDTGSNKKISSSARKSMDASSNLLSNLSSLLAGMTEDMLITEYGVQMFSYYTVHKNMDGTNIAADDIVSLSGFKFSNDSTAMYRSEIEYLLWGDRSADKNVTYTLTTLFGVRFLINILCAFTNHKLIGETAQLSSGASFGAPLLQAVLLLAAALAETAKDMNRLTQGKPVLIIKPVDKWASYYSFSGYNRDVDNGFDTLTYKEYLRVFLLLNNFSDANQKKILARMADCIQFNLRKVSSKPLDITQSYTMVAAVADVAVNTTFMDKIPRIVNSSSANTSNRYVIHYKSVLAY